MKFLLGMTIMVWWPYQEKDSMPKDGRYREAHVIETEVPWNDKDDDAGKSQS